MSTPPMRRRRTGAGTIPAGVVAWFEGRGELPWDALLPEDEAGLLRHWNAFVEVHPGAEHPSDAPWIGWPAPMQ